MSKSTGQGSAELLERAMRCFKCGEMVCRTHAEGAALLYSNPSSPSALAESWQESLFQEKDLCLSSWLYYLKALPQCCDISKFQLEFWRGQTILRLQPTDRGLGDTERTQEECQTWPNLALWREDMEWPGCQIGRAGQGQEAWT